jgi:hypothetical protein
MEASGDHSTGTSTARSHGQHARPHAAEHPDSPRCERGFLASQEAGLTRLRARVHKKIATMIGAMIRTTRSGYPSQTGSTDPSQVLVVVTAAPSETVVVVTPQGPPKEKKSRKTGAARPPGTTSVPSHFSPRVHALEDHRRMTPTSQPTPTNREPRGSSHTAPASTTMLGWRLRDLRSNARRHARIIPEGVLTARVNRKAGNIRLRRRVRAVRAGRCTCWLSRRRLVRFQPGSVRRTGTGEWSSRLR